ncbi:MAG: serine/threonine protein kinase [Gemmataceae bacterium]|nr:serine/threonine protein kinase [Gemmataceae bacterium]
MPMPPVASLVALLHELPLLGPAGREELAGAAARCADPGALIRHLVGRGLLTPYQGNELARGHGRDLLLGHYVLLERLGGGGMGQVFKARHRHLDRLDAVKLIRTGQLDRPEAVERFRREARAAARLCHPHVVRVHDFGEDGGRYFLAMEYVAGTDLDRIVRRDGPLAIGRACRVLYQTALGLQHAFEQGLVHRDVKPANLLLVALAPGQPAETEVVKILDLGLARPAHSDEETAASLTAAGMVIGTPDYVAPEQTYDARTVDIRADLYGLGCTAYYLLTGQVPFPGGGLVEKVLRQRQEEAEPPERLRPEVPPVLAVVVRRLMAKDPAQRYQTPAELAAALEPLLPPPQAPTEVSAAPTADSVAGTEIAPPYRPLIPPAAPLPPALSPTRGGGWGVRWRAALAGGAALILVVLLLLLFSGTGTTPEDPPRPPPPPPPRWEEAHVLQVSKGPHIALAFGPNPNTLAVGSGGWPTSKGPFAVFLWDLVSGKTTPLGEHADPVRCLAFATDGKRLASGTGLLAAEGGGDVIIWDVEAARAGQPERRWKAWEAHPGGVGGLTFSARDQTLVTGGSASTGDRSLKRWNVATGAELRLVGTHALGISALTLAPDGGLLVSGGEDRVVKIWKLAKRQLVTTLAQHPQTIRGLAFSPDGQMLATAAARFSGAPAAAGPVALWDVSTGQKRPLVLEFDGADPAPAVWCVAFHPDRDSGLLAGGSTDGRVWLWNAEGRLRGSFAAHKGATLALAFSRDGRWLATAGLYGDVKIWRGRTP